MNQSLYRRFYQTQINRKKIYFRFSIIWMLKVSLDLCSKDFKKFIDDQVRFKSLVVYTSQFPVSTWSLSNNLLSYQRSIKLSKPT